ncbi:MAG TPA: ABC transporter ATP-binding protein [Candidatus Aminicenantes bacterium]|nr:ABC transporter ATP-binding protein [Candidatus Aminicenantes bacterium]HDT14497.1 ABC transporter ATP-binding protein [Candidatus Aminicenantes bacterium]
MSIEVKDLSFRYGRITALDGVSMKLEEGAVGLLGPNGAGKSTLLRILLGFLVPERGEGKVLGYDIRREQALIRRAVGYMPESDCFIAGMDAVTFTSYFGELSGMPRQEAMKRAHEVLYYVGLGEARYRLLDTYSAGMKQRLKLAQALVHDPKILFLDEPTSNLDPTGRVEILELIRDISSNKSIQVLLSSHILDDIEALCESVVILKQGRLAAEGRMADLRAIHYSLYEVRIKGDGGPFREDLEGLGARVDETADGLVKIYMPEGGDRMDIFRAAVRAGVQLRSFVKSRTSLEDLFAGVVGVD